MTAFIPTNIQQNAVVGKVIRSVITDLGNIYNYNLRT